jgi:hypothetical protein
MSSLRVRRAEARPTILLVSWTTPRHQHALQRKKTVPAESAAVCGGKLQSKGLGFGAKCNKPSHLHSLLTHRNLRRAGRRLKRAFRFRKFFGYFLPKKVTTRTNTALCLRHGVGRDATVFGWRAGRESRATPVTPKALHRTGSGQRPDPPTRQSRSVIPERDSSLPEPHGCRGPLLHKTNMRRNKNLRARNRRRCAEGSFNRRG